jgi:hypothetical protein
MSSIFCKYCLSSDGQMISPCLCKGSIGYVHNRCLQDWIYSKSQSKPCCEICKIPFKIIWNLDNKQEKLIQDIAKNMFYISVILIVCYIFLGSIIYCLGVVIVQEQNILLTITSNGLITTHLYLYVLNIIIQLGEGENDWIKILLESIYTSPFCIHINITFEIIHHYNSKYSNKIIDILSY